MCLNILYVYFRLLLHYHIWIGSFHQLCIGHFSSLTCGKKRMFLACINCSEEYQNDSIWTAKEYLNSPWLWWWDLHEKTNFVRHWSCRIFPICWVFWFSSGLLLNFYNVVCWHILSPTETFILLILYSWSLMFMHLVPPDYSSVDEDIRINI